MPDQANQKSKNIFKEIGGADPLKVGLMAFLVSVFLSRLVGFLVIDGHVLPASVFVDIHGYRLHHFVYGNIILTVLGFLTFILNVEIAPGIAAMIYGIGLGFVMDEFILWLGSITYLSVNSIWVFNTANSLAVIAVAALMMYFIYQRGKKKKLAAKGSGNIAAKEIFFTPEMQNENLNIQKKNV